MNKMALLIFFFTTLFTSEITYYWNLGIAIKKDKPTQRIVQKDVVLSNSTFYAQTENRPQDIYTLQRNYLIEPKKNTQNRPENKKTTQKPSQPIKELILNEEYFEAAKQIIELEEADVKNEFENPDDYHYWTSFVYFNLGNHEEARQNIEQILDKENDVRALFLESLIIRKKKVQESDNILQKIIKNFPNNEYSEYARSLLIDGK